MALRLDDGRILIGGGTDASGTPVGRLEWLTPDASSEYFTPTALPPRPAAGSFPESPAWHLAPDRSPLGPDAGIRFDPARGLVLDGDYATALLTDTSYASLRLEMKLVEGAPPRVLLGGRELGGADCAWPASSSDALVLLRNGGKVQLERGRARKVCAVSQDRLTVAFAAGGPKRHSVIRELTVRRDAP